MPSRRSVLRAAGALALVPLAGCASDVHYPEEQPGQPDVVLKNCQQESVALHLTATRLATDTVVHDHTHTVPAEFCSDMGPSYYVEDVWTDPGDYRLRASAPTLATATATVTVPRSALEDDTVTRTVYVDDGAIDLPS